jgi:phosphate/sulfate permease
LFDCVCLGGLTNDTLQTARDDRIPSEMRTVLLLVLSPLIGALVAILFTGKVQGALSSRSQARRLRIRVRHALTVGQAREQFGWWDVPKIDLDDVSSRLIVLGEDAASVDLNAAQAIWHASQLVPVFVRSRDSVESSDHAVVRSVENYKLDRALKDVQNSVNSRDSALAAIADIYRELIAADESLGKVSRWARFIEGRNELSPPDAFKAALDYADRLLDGAITWEEPSPTIFEQYRVQTIASHLPPWTNSPDIDELPRRKLITEGMDVIDQFPGNRRRNGSGLAQP